MSQLEQGRVSRLHGNGGEREFGQSLQLEGECPVGECGGEVVEALPLDRGEQVPIGRVDGVIDGGDGRPHGLRTLLGEAASRPFTWVKTNCERASRERSRTRSIAAPRLWQRSTGVCSTISAS